jgi:hypothetical protein
MNIRTTLFAALVLLFCLPLTANADSSKCNSVCKFVPQVELDFTKRLATSPKPVSIKIQGSKLFVQSDACQLLPVYRKTGTFYCAFKLTKGTNILSGLPKGIYVINNKKFVLS